MTEDEAVKALEDVLADYYGGIPTEWVLMSHVIDGTGDIVEDIMVKPDQLMTHTAGLLAYGQMRWNAVMSRNTEDDDE